MGSLSWENPSILSLIFTDWFLSCPTWPVHSDLCFLSTPNDIMVESISWIFILVPKDSHQPTGILSHSSCTPPPPWYTVESMQRRFGKYVPYLIPRQTLFLPWQTWPVCRIALRATTLMKTATVVNPATALVGHVKGDTAHSASPAHQAGSSWERSACPSAGKGKLLNPLFPHLIP